MNKSLLHSSGTNNTIQGQDRARVRNPGLSRRGGGGQLGTMRFGFQYSECAGYIIITDDVINPYYAEK